MEEFMAPNARTKKVEELKSPVTSTGNNNGANNKLTYFIIGFGVGAIGALLLAPRFGKEMREKISDGALLFASKLGQDLRGQIDKTTQQGYQTAHQITEELAEKAQEMITAILEEAKGAIARSTDQLSGVIEEAKDTVIKSAERLSDVIQEGKQAYMEEKSKDESGDLNHGT